ncbi:hypothetical protein [Alteromonas sp. H39]
MNAIVTRYAPSDITKTMSKKRTQKMRKWLHAYRKLFNNAMTMK